MPEIIILFLINLFIQDYRKKKKEEKGLDLAENRYKKTGKRLENPIKKLIKDDNLKETFINKEDILNKKEKELKGKELELEEKLANLERKIANKEKKIDKNKIETPRNKELLKNLKLGVVMSEILNEPKAKRRKTFK